MAMRNSSGIGLMMVRCKKITRRVAPKTTPTRVGARCQVRLSAWSTSQCTNSSNRPRWPAAHNPGLIAAAETSPQGGRLTASVLLALRASPWSLPYASQTGTSADAKNSVLWKLLKGIAHIQPVCIGKIVKATPRIAEWTGIKGNVRIQLILEKYAGKQKIGSE